MPRRRILPGQSRAVSRRTTRRYHLFVPDESGRTERIFWYVLAWAAKEHGILVHAAVLMSNHVHLVITDVRGLAPDFFRDFHRIFALCTKAKLGWPEDVFNKSKTNAPEILTPHAMMESLAYAIANPTAAGLVRRASEWPGARTTARDMGTRTVVAKRPPEYLRGPEWPETMELEITLPPTLLDEMKPEDIYRRVDAQVRELEREALATAKEKGRKFLGARRAMRVSHTHRASSWEKFGSREPRFKAAGDLEAARAAVAKYRQFERDYDEALTGWTDGNRAVVLPAGTWWMAVHHGVRTRPPP